MLAFVFGTVALPTFGEEGVEAFRPGPLIDPSGHAMDHFFRALDATASRRDGAITRVTHFGDSLIVADHITGTLRREFQARFGDAGPGFALAGRPREWYRHDGVRVRASGGWRELNALRGGAGDRFFGYGAIAFATRRARRRVSYVPAESTVGRPTFSSIDVHYLAQPRGGDLEVIVDNEHLLTISTEGEAAHSAFHRVDIPEGPHEVTLRTGGGPIRLFGVALERHVPGVVYDSVGVTGACTTVLGRIDAEHLGEQLQHRRTNLIVFAFGANESNRPALVREYDETVLPVIRQVHHAAPDASCLIMSTLDRGERGEGGDGSNPHVRRIVEAQRRAAEEVGCAFFDAYAAMGGAGAMRRWSRLGLASPDMVHPTPEGSELIGRGLYRSIVAAYEAWRADGDAH